MLGTSGSGASKATGGSNSKTIAQANLPNVKLTVNSFSLSRGTQNITGNLKTSTDGKVSYAGSFYESSDTSTTYIFAATSTTKYVKFDASKSWTGSTNSVSPQTSALGSGSALDVTPAYYTCHMWLRLT